MFQLENLVGGTVAYQQRVTAHLVPCVGQFAVALADDTQWKKLNYQILLKTRHSDAKVRTPGPDVPKLRPSTRACLRGGCRVYVL